jgi:hypothetical protein
MFRVHKRICQTFSPPLQKIKRRTPILSDKFGKGLSDLSDFFVSDTPFLAEKFHFADWLGFRIWSVKKLV